MEHVSEKRFPLNGKDYKLYEEVGEGVSASVYRALCIPLNEIVAIKVLDLEKCNNDLVCSLISYAIAICKFVLFSDFCVLYFIAYLVIDHIIEYFLFSKGMKIIVLVVWL